MFRGKVGTIHFVGIGGIGMSGIAEVLLNLGYVVTGSDLKEGESVRRLRGLGATVHIGHAREHVGEVDVVVRSTAVREDNPEVEEAARRGVPVIRRAEMLAELMRLKYGLAVAGTHGKTTTTSMLATCCGAGGLDPTVVIGGRLDNLGGTNAKLGAGDYLVAEADESDGSFMLLSPTVAVVTNIDAEHLDHYGTMDALEDTFADFVNKVPFYGFVVLCIDHPRVQALLPKVRRRVVTYGFASQADYRIRSVAYEGECSRFVLHHEGESLGEIALGMPGQHNVANAAAAAAAAHQLSIPFASIQSALDGFSGVQRRFTVVGERGGVLYVDDYGHHPVEIEATLGAACEGYPERRVVAVFQPHRFTRVRDLWAEFSGCFNRADRVVVCPVYPAGEAPIEGVDHERLAQEIRDRGHRSVWSVDSLEDAAALLEEESASGDLVISLGAGNVNQVVNQLSKGSGVG